VETIIRSLQDVHQKFRFYETDRLGLVSNAFRIQGCTDITVAVGGYRLILQVMDGVIGTIIPKAKSAQPQYGGGGTIFLLAWPGEPRHGKKPFTIGDYTYEAPYGGSSRLSEALKLAREAFQRAEGNIALFYQALGILGSCAICGASLTDPLSRARGIGPECIKKIEASVYVAALQDARAQHLADYLYKVASGIDAGGTVTLGEVGRASLTPSLASVGFKFGTGGS
jgi:hypothetical protein